MRQIKQSLCRHWATQICRACLWLFLVVFLGHAGWAGAAKARPSPVTPAASAPATAPVTPDEVLQQSVTQWVGRQQGVPADQVQMMPLDARVKVQSCARPLNMDLPFASSETVRVRCPDPVWQLYVRVQLSAPDARHAAAAASAGGEQRPVLVTVTSLSRGMSVQAADVRLQSMPVPPGAGPVLDNITEALHSEVLRDLPAGTVVRRADLKPAMLVRRGQLVQLSIGHNQGFSVSVRVEALQDGRMGEQVKLKNPESGRILTGVVKGPNLVEGL